MAAEFAHALAFSMPGELNVPPGPVAKLPRVDQRRRLLWKKCRVLGGTPLPGAQLQIAGRLTAEPRGQIGADPLDQPPSEKDGRLVDLV